MTTEPTHDGVDGLLRGARILVVEDDPLLLMELETILEEAGAVVAGLCRSVDEALAVAADGDLSAAVLDFRLGHETVAPVARYLTARATPFLFYTGQVEGEASLAEWPAHRIVQKPAASRALVAAMAGLLGR